MYKAGLQIEPYPVFGNELFYEKMFTSKQDIDAISAVFSKGETFSDHFKLIMSKISIQDWSSLTGQMCKLKIDELRTLFSGVIQCGYLATADDNRSAIATVEASKQLFQSNDNVKAYEPTTANLQFQEVLQNVSDAGLLLHNGYKVIRYLWKQFNVHMSCKRNHENHIQYAQLFQQFLSCIADRRKYRITTWIEINTRDVTKSDEDKSQICKFMSNVQGQFTKNISDKLIICGQKCSKCDYQCLLARYHETITEHDCLLFDDKTEHKCKQECHYKCDNECGHPCGHSGEHNCIRAKHTCGKGQCSMMKFRNCNKTCALLIDHKDECQCNAVHYCDADCQVMNCANKCNIYVTTSSQSPLVTSHESHLCSEKRCQHKCQVLTCKSLNNGSQQAVEMCGSQCNHEHGHESKYNADAEAEAETEHKYADNNSTSNSNSNSNNEAVKLQHICSQEHACPKMCQNPGNCATSVFALKIINADNTESVLNEMCAVRSYCVIPIPVGQFHHSEEDKAHFCYPNKEVPTVHTCNRKCLACGYYCTKEFKHYDELCKTSHGNMKLTQFMAATKQKFQLGDSDTSHKFGDSGCPEFCSIFCSKLGRGHIHLQYCEASQSGNTCVDPNEERRHATTVYYPHPGRQKDELTHKQYWSNMRFEDPNPGEAVKFSKCAYFCSHKSHKDTKGKITEYVYCKGDLWHDPYAQSSSNKQQSVTRKGHLIPCRHSSFHIIFAIDRSSSMGWTDMKPSFPFIKLSDNNLDNRLGAAYNAMQGFINQRLGNCEHDTISCILFNTAAQLIVNREECYQDLVKDKCLQYSYAGDTKYACAFSIVNHHNLLRNDEQTIMIFLTDGNCCDCATDIIKKIKTKYGTNFILHGVQIYNGWGFGIVKDEPLKSMAATGGGSYLKGSTDGIQLTNQFIQIADKIKEVTLAPHNNHN